MSLTRHTLRARGYNAITVEHLTGQVIVPAGGKHRADRPETLAEFCARVVDGPTTQPLTVPGMRPALGGAR